MKESTSSACRALLLAALSMVATTSVVNAAEATSAETKARMISLISKLESDPFTRDGRDIRGEVISWLTEAPDVTVKVCTNVLGDITKIKGDDGGTLVVQLMLSEAKFILEHPDKEADQLAVNVAGIEGVLRTYAAMRAVKPKLAIREFDQLAQLQTSGQLAAETDKRLATCN